MSLPEKGTFKIQTLGPKKDIPNKKDENHPWRSWSLQFEGDPNWYDTFWLAKEDPTVGQELTGTKSEDPKFGLKFETERQGGGKSNWNPAGAQSTIMHAAATVVQGFLSIGNNYELWEGNDPKVKENFAKYVNTVASVADTLKEKVVAMGALSQETKVAEKKSASSDEPAPGTPPEIPGWPEDEEEVEV